MQASLSSYIDHTLLRPDVTKQEIHKLCEEALKYCFASVCVPPYWVKDAYDLLKESTVKVSSVVGFPLGFHLPETKLAEAIQLSKIGAQELDMVINLPALKAKDFDTVANEIKSIVKACQPAKIKVIIETALLNDDEKKIACLLAKEANAHFVKTSTGFSKQGATIRDIKLMRSAVGPDIGIKASGGISTQSQALKLIDAGANRIGTSKGVALLQVE